MVHIEIETDNAAFEGENRGYEIARILRKIANDYERSGCPELICMRDINGNAVCNIRDDDTGIVME